MRKNIDYEIAVTDAMIDILNKEDISEVMELFCQCFSDDHYYNTKLFPNEKEMNKAMKESFEDAILYCLTSGYSLGIRKCGKLIGFLLSFDYKYTMTTNSKIHYLIFVGKDATGSLPYCNTLHNVISKLPGRVMYCLSLAVDASYRRLGLASAMLDCMMSRFPDFSFATDISNSSSLEIYKKRSFNIQLLDNNYYLATYSLTQRR